SRADVLVRRIKVVRSQQNGREYLYEALDYVAKGKVKVIAETYPLAEVNRAYDRVAEGKVRFRAVIVINEQRSATRIATSRGPSTLHSRIRISVHANRSVVSTVRR